MEVWICLLLIGAAGAVGGFVNAFLSDNGFLLPQKQRSGEATIIRPGFLGNVFSGAVAACVSWGLYGSFANKGLSDRIDLPLSALVGGVLVGIVGSRWLTNEVDKRLLRAAASEAARKSPGASVDIMKSTPAEALNIAQNLPGGF